MNAPTIAVLDAYIIFWDVDLGAHLLGLDNDTHFTAKARRSDPKATPYKTPYRIRLIDYVGNFKYIMPDSTDLSTPQDQTFKEFERLVSRHRLRRYRRETGGKAEAIGLYLWNVALSEALYPAFHFFEVALRNATHQTISAQRNGNSRWFMDMSILTEPRHQQQVLDAIQELRRQHKGHFVGDEGDTDFPKEPQRIVAELTLGFWVNLFSDPYTTTQVSQIAASVFPNGPKEVVRDHRQDFIYPRLRDALDLRNRVFHHEPIYHWTLEGSSPTLMQRYERLRELLTWMCHTQPAFLEGLDRFVDVHNNGRNRCNDVAEFALLQDEERQRREQTSA